MEIAAFVCKTMSDEEEKARNMALHTKIGESYTLVSEGSI